MQVCQSKSITTTVFSTSQKQDMPARASDAQNACLTPGIDRQTCIQHLRDNYVLLGLPSTTISGDHLEYVPAGNDLDTCTTCSITTNLATNQGTGTSIQQLTVNIPHEIIRQQLSTRIDLLHRQWRGSKQTCVWCGDDVFCRLPMEMVGARRLIIC